MQRYTPYELCVVVRYNCDIKAHNTMRRTQKDRITTLYYSTANDGQLINPYVA